MGHWEPLDLREGREKEQEVQKRRGSLVLGSESPHICMVVNMWCPIGNLHFTWAWGSCLKIPLRH